MPGDPDRTKRPRGFNPPGDGNFAGVRYIGAASFPRGGFVDVWIVKSTARAAELSASFEDPSLNEPEAKDWYFENNRNILMGTHATGTGKLGDPSLKKFDRCLRSA